MFRKILLLSFVLVIYSNLCNAQMNDSIMLRKIYDQALENGKAYDWLHELCFKIGNRVSGSPQADKAVKWGDSLMRTLGYDSVFLQPCMVPQWWRGPKEKAHFMVGKKKVDVNILALGGSIATPKEGMDAAIVMIDTFDDIDSMMVEACRGKILFINGKMNQKNIRTFQSYGHCVRQRWAGASAAAKKGAIAVVVRSVGTSTDEFPHTGSMGYEENIAQIPACAISTIHADMLEAQLKKHKGDDGAVRFYFNQQCKMLEEKQSYNVVGEIRGSQFPNEIIIVGGHLDSWDVGHGAHDDGAGVVQSMQVLHSFKALGIKPKRTIRAVLFMNEENGGRGGTKYAELAAANKENTIAAIETDAGGFSPQGFSFENDSLRAFKVRSYKNLFEPYQLFSWNYSGGGADINHLRNQGTLLIGLVPDSQRYFDIHHTAADTFDKVNKRELHLGAAAMTGLVYLMSEYGF